MIKLLVVTRKRGQSILIGDDIEITVVSVDDGVVKIALSAPKSVTILRKELLKEVSEENIKATQFDANLIKNIKR